MQHIRLILYSALSCNYLKITKRERDKEKENEHCSEEVKAK